MSITAVENIVVTATSRPSGLTEAVCLGQPTGARTLARTLPTASRVRGSTKTAKIGPWLAGLPHCKTGTTQSPVRPASSGSPMTISSAGIDAGDPRRTDLRAEPLPVGEVPGGHGPVVAGGVRASALPVHRQSVDSAGAGGQHLPAHPAASDQVADHEPLVGRR